MVVERFWKENSGVRGVTGLEDGLGGEGRKGVGGGARSERGKFEEGEICK